MEDSLEIGLNGKDFELNRNNTSLFHYLGQAAMYNHVFIVIQRNEDGTAEATHVFEQALPEAYEQLATFITANAFPQHLNMLEAAECDVDAFNSTMFSDLAAADHIPEEWENGTTH